MTKHHQLVIEILCGNLFKVMREPDGVYTQCDNRRHNQTGHLFQGRFKGLL